MQILRFFFLDIQSYSRHHILQMYKFSIDHFICIVLLYNSR